MNFMFSARGLPLIVIDGYKFRFHKKLSNNAERWVCTRKTCKSFLKIDQNKHLLVGDKNHDHENEESSIPIQKLNNSLKIKAIEDISSQSSKLIHRELRNSQTDSVTTQDITRIKRNVNRARRSGFPKVIKKRQEFHESDKNTIGTIAEHFWVSDRNSDVVVDGSYGKR